MKPPKRILVLSPSEYRLMLHGLLHFRNIRRYFPQNYTTIQMTNDIMKGLELLRKQRARSKDAR